MPSEAYWKAYCRQDCLAPQEGLAGRLAAGGRSHETQRLCRCGFAAVIGGLGIVIDGAWIGRRKAARSMAPLGLRVDHDAPEAFAEPLDPRSDHRRLGGRAGSRLDHSSRGLARTRRTARRCEARYLAVLRSRAAGAGVRSGGRPARKLGRAGSGLRLAGFEPRDHHRLQRQRVDRRKRARRRSAGDGE